MNTNHRGLKILIFLIAIGVIVWAYIVMVKRNPSMSIVSTTPTSTTPVFNPPVPPSTPIPVTTTTVTEDSLSPVSGPVGTTVTIYGSGFATDDKVLLEGSVGSTNTHLTSLENGQQALVFTVPTSIGPNCKPDQACPQYLRLVTPTTYQITVENDKGTSNSLSFVVTGATQNPGIQ